MAMIVRPKEGFGNQLMMALSMRMPIFEWKGVCSNNLLSAIAMKAFKIMPQRQEASVTSEKNMVVLDLEEGSGEEALPINSSVESKAKKKGGVQSSDKLVGYEATERMAPGIAERVRSLNAAVIAGRGACKRS